MENNEKKQALGLAFYMIDYVYKENLESYLSALKIGTLLYIAQGASLSLFQKTLFDDEIKKCGYGIRIEEVDSHFIKYGGNTIWPYYKELNYKIWKNLVSIPYYKKYLVHPDSHDLFTNVYYKNENLDKTTKMILESVINNFCKLSLPDLVNNIIYNSWAYQMSRENIDLEYLKKEYDSYHIEMIEEVNEK